MAEGGLVQSANRWLQTSRRSASARVRLIAFPPAGIGPGLFRGWYALVPEWIELWAVCPPGREVRLDEEPVTDLREHVGRILTGIESLPAGPVAFFGHSMGALVAREVTRGLRARGASLPVHLFVSGHRAPSVKRTTPDDHGRPDEELLRIVRERWGGMPPELATDPEEAAMVMRPLRADLRAIERYEIPLGDPVDVPLTAFGGASDPILPGSSLEAWRHETTGDFELRRFPGGHRYLDRAAAAVVAHVVERLSDRS